MTLRKKLCGLAKLHGLARRQGEWGGFWFFDFRGSRSALPPPAWAKPMPAPAVSGVAAGSATNNKLFPDNRLNRQPTTCDGLLRFQETPNVGIQRMAKPVRWNDGLGGTARPKRANLAVGLQSWPVSPINAFVQTVA